MGFKLGKKLGKAVVRNLLRRRLQAILEAWVPAPGEGAHLVALAGGGAPRVSYRKLAARVGKELRRAGFVPRLPEGAG